MTKDRWIIALIYLLGAIATVLLIPKPKRREAIMAFLACQPLTWLDSLLHVKFHLLSFPVREFPKATDLLFTTEYFLYPLICALYIANEPKGALSARLAALALTVSALTGIVALLVTYSNLIRYERYSWYWTWIRLFLEFTVVRLYCGWYFKSEPTAN